MFSVAEARSTSSAWFRGVPLDYDGWAKRGMTGWGWTDVLPFFSATRRDHELGASTYHGTGGPMPVTTAPDVNPLSLAFITAGVEKGLDLNRDFNGARRDGRGSPVQQTSATVNGSARARGYLHPVLYGTGLTVLTGATRPTRTDQEPRSDRRGIHRCRGADGTARQARVGRPVRGNAAHSSAAHAVRHRSRPANSPREASTSSPIYPGVGQNLHDHPIVAAAWAGHPGRDVGPTQRVRRTPERYATARRGPLASIGQGGPPFLRCGPGHSRPRRPTHPHA